MKGKSGMTRFILCTSMLAVGSMIYASCRRSALAYEHILNALFRSEWIGIKPLLGRLCPADLAMTTVGEVIVFSIPNTLWCISLCLFLLGELGWIKSITAAKRYSVLVLVCILPELLQLVHAIPGRYDPSDIALAALSPFIATKLDDLLTKRHGRT